MALPAGATEGAGSSYPAGVEVTYGNMLPPGNYHLAYYSLYESNSIKGENGGDNKAFLKFKIKADSLSYRFQHVWAGKLLGAGVESVLAVPFPVVDLTKVTSGGSSGGYAYGLADSLLIPARLAWKNGNVSQSATVEFGVPVGVYDKDERVNTGRHYWQAAPCYAVTARPAPGFDVNTKLRYAFNSQNPATHYRSGDEFSAEFSAGYQALPAAALSLQGYYYLQTTNDEVRGKPTSSGISPARGGLPGTGTGNRGTVAALGPQLRYAFSKTCVAIVKYQREFSAKNRTEGDRFWLQVLLPL